MNETVLLDMDAVLLERVRRLAGAKGWGQQEAMIHLLEHGLFACEVEVAARLDDTDAVALQAAIAALEQIDSDPGFSLIGRVGASDAGATAEGAGRTDDAPSADRHY
ncbi:MAG TPA: hypothetical protein VLZ76_10325 [Lysobacter sp.]|jgi:hypothetical protein|nr:hypothetical protein [Lysobacter sp.]